MATTLRTHTTKDICSRLSRIMAFIVLSQIPLEPYENERPEKAREDYKQAYCAHGKQNIPKRRNTKLEYQKKVGEILDRPFRAPPTSTIYRVRDKVSILEPVRLAPQWPRLRSRRQYVFVNIANNLVREGDTTPVSGGRSAHLKTTVLTSDLRISSESASRILYTQGDCV
jgi:hypothetical protein